MSAPPVLGDGVACVRSEFGACGCCDDCLPFFVPRSGNGRLEKVDSGIPADVAGRGGGTFAVEPLDDADVVDERTF